MNELMKGIVYETQQSATRYDLLRLQNLHGHAGQGKTGTAWHGMANGLVSYFWLYCIAVQKERTRADSCFIPFRPKTKDIEQ